MKKILLLLMTVLLCSSMQAQVFRTGDRLPKPVMLRPQHSTEMFSRKAAPKPKRTKTEKTARPERKKAFTVDNMEINEYWGATRSSMWEIGANLHIIEFDPHTSHYSISKSVPLALNVDWIRSLSGSFGTAVIPYFGFGILGGYETNHGALAGSASADLGVMFGRKKFKLDLRIQPSLTYCSSFRYTTRSYSYDSYWGYYDYRDHYTDFLGFTLNGSVGIYYSKIHLRAFYYLMGVDSGFGFRLGFNF